MKFTTRSKIFITLLFLLMIIMGFGHELLRPGFGYFSDLGQKMVRYGFDENGQPFYNKFYNFFWLMGIRINFLIDAIFILFLVINRKKVNYSFLFFFIAITLMRVVDVFQLLGYGDKGVLSFFEIGFNVLGFIFLLMSFDVIPVNILNKSIEKQTTDVILFSLPFSKLFKKWFGKDKVRTEAEVLEELYTTKDVLHKVAETRNVEDQTLMSSITFLIDDLADEPHPDKREKLKQKYYSLLSQYMVNGQKIEDLLAKATKK